jgi:hypothetical protein
VKVDDAVKSSKSSAAVGFPGSHLNDPRESDGQLSVPLQSQKHDIAELCRDGASEHNVPQGRKTDHQSAHRSNSSSFVAGVSKQGGCVCPRGHTFL